VHLASAGFQVLLWARRREVADRIRDEGRNEEYLPGVELPEGVSTTHSLEQLEGCDPILVVVPSHGFRVVLERLLEEIRGEESLNIVSATKGVEVETVSRMSQVSAQVARAAGRRIRFAVLSGPTFAAELARGVPSAAVVASEREELSMELAERISTPRFRLYSSADVVGVELGGTAKNVIAIAAGVVSGLGLGHNTLAALITRGLHEIARLGVACGGQDRTFAGLAGLGDLVLTCTGGLSRNRRTGMELAAGKSLQQIESETSMVAEGIRNSRSITRLAAGRQIEMPICEQMMAIMYEGKPVAHAVEELMTRELKREASL
jgi:glycerol-3-phosphate dehydrogenase (NAD(P)+)